MAQEGEPRNGVAARSQRFIGSKDGWVVFIFELNAVRRLRQNGPKCPQCPQKWFLSAVTPATSA